MVYEKSNEEYLRVVAKDLENFGLTVKVLFEYYIPRSSHPVKFLYLQYHFANLYSKMTRCITPT